MTKLECLKNSEARMSNEHRDRSRWLAGSRISTTPRESSLRHSDSVPLSSFVLRHSTFLIVLAATAMPVVADEQRTSTVGMPTRIDQIVLPGSELEVRPLEDSRSPIVLRITESFRHGSGFRYDMVYYGLDPGHFDLREYLRRKDATSSDDLPEIPVEVVPVLPPGQIEPNRLESKQAPALGGYRTTLVLGAVLWTAGLLAILFLKRKETGGVEASGVRPVSFAERLRPLVEAAVAGKLTDSRQAELERLLIAYWRRRLNLDGLRPADAIATLRRHNEAGQLLGRLEEWLHRPNREREREVDVAELLKPYQNVLADF